MKFSIKTSIILAAIAVACAEPDAPVPAPSFTPQTYTADFSFINAVADGPASGLDFYVNNSKIGSTSTFLTGVGHTTVPMTLFVGSTGAVGANTNIRVKASSGPIGGVIGSSDLVYRAGNTNNNIPALAPTTPATATAAAVVARYTLIALDSITRPAPLRKLNALHFGDTTYFNKLTGKYISVVTRDSIRKGLKPPYTIANLVAIGTVPLGSTDPGGPRFCLLTDSYIPATLASATQSSFRLINASPNAPALFARIKYTGGPAGGANINLPAGGGGASASYIMAFPAFTPSVGSRATTSAFGAGQTTFVTGVGGGSFVYDIEVSTEATFTTGLIDSAKTTGAAFLPGKHYSIVISGIYGKTLKVNYVQHN